MVGVGVNEQGEPNTAKTLPQNYWLRIGNEIHEPFVYDASYIRLRQLRLNFRLPSRLLRNTPVRFATISLVGRNLWLIYDKVDNVDPEALTGNGNGQMGLEYLGVPPTRTFGINFNMHL